MPGTGDLMEKQRIKRGGDPQNSSFNQSHGDLARKMVTVSWDREDGFSGYATNINQQYESTNGGFNV
jgi:hypothetical protein